MSKSELTMVCPTEEKSETALAMTKAGLDLSPKQNNSSKFLQSYGNAMSGIWSLTIGQITTLTS